MTFAPFVRRWGVLVLGAIVLGFGLTILLSHSTIAFGWDGYPWSFALFPGLPHAGSGLTHLAQDRHVSLNGQVSIVVGVLLIGGWSAVTLRARRAIAQQTTTSWAGQSATEG